MSDPRHRRPDRRRGVRFRARPGRRRATVAESTPTRQELRQAAAAQRKRAARRNILLAIIGAVAIVATAVLVSWWVGRDDGASTETSVMIDVPEEGSSLLVGVLDDEERVMAIALMAAGPNAGERVVLLQPSLLTTLPGFGENVLSNSVRFDDTGLLASTVANLLGARIDNVVVVGAESLSRAIEDPITVDLPVPFIVADGTAQVVIAGTGPVGRDGAMIARLLTETGLSDELELLERQGAVWEALLTEPEVLLMALGDDTARVAETVRTVSQGDPILTSVPSTRIEPSGDEERYQLDGADAAAFTSAEFPYLQLGEEPRVRVEVLNGNGLIGTTRPVADRLIEFGFRVVFTDNADRSDYPMTLIIAQGRQFQNAALTARDAMRIGEVSVELRQPSGVVDLTIIVGQDLPAGG